MISEKSPGLAMFHETSLAEAEGVGLALPGDKLLDSLRCFAARHVLGVARARVEGHPPQPPGLGLIATLLGQDGEVAQGEMAVDALVDATELVGSFSPLATSHFLHIHWPLATGHYPPATRHYSERILQSDLSFRYRSPGSV